MKLIKYISDFNLKISNSDSETDNTWNTRIASRAVIKDNQGRILLMYAKKLNLYKLPGGGIEGVETIEEGLKREVEEETGFVIDNIKEFGVVVEKRDSWKLFQISHCFSALIRSEGKQNLTEEEKESEFQVFWVNNIKNAIDLVKSSSELGYDEKFIKVRDAEILSCFI